MDSLADWIVAVFVALGGGAGIGYLVLAIARARNAGRRNNRADVSALAEYVEADAARDRLERDGAVAELERVRVARWKWIHHAARLANQVRALGGVPEEPPEEL